ncbi:MAG TPA: GNAT family N-acetyltransferase [Ignavibacteria bacterium]|nr:GNAT family N-acetyltransferase [Ignavibacteria bacterium]
MRYIKKISDKKVIENFYRKNTCLNVYPIGDLDDFFFTKTEWFALLEKQNDIEEIIEMAFIYRGTDLPVLIAVCDGDNLNLKELLNRILKDVPDNIYTHFSKGLDEVFERSYDKLDYGRHFKMCLRENDFKEFNEANENKGLDYIKRLSPSDIDVISEFYKKSYPDNWFDLRMLETGKYFGYYFEDELIGVAGIHVYSPEFKVAALGNITTLSEHRGRSVCRKLTSVLCRDLFKTTDQIGLNVHSENLPAIKCYQNLGFTIAGEYFESTFKKKK